MTITITDITVEEFHRTIVESARERFPTLIPLPVHLADGFLRTLARSNADWRKVAAVAAEAAVGVADRAPGRRTHRLREHRATGRVVLWDGDPVQRSAIQVASPAARRLHWARAARQVTLISVRLHDDMRA